MRDQKNSRSCSSTWRGSNVLVPQVPKFSFWIMHGLRPASGLGGAEVHERPHYALFSRLRSPQRGAAVPNQ
jgi:hypothetical protein